MLRLHDYLDSGNGYKVRLLLTQLGRPFERIEYDILQGQTRTPEFLDRNLNGRIPVLETENGAFLAESGAILFYLAQGTPFLPDDNFALAQVLQWMFFEQYSHEPYIATVRSWLTHQETLSEVQQAMLPQRREGGYAALQVMERHLAGHGFFVGERYTIADIALYAYTHVAGEGGYELAGYPAVLAWLERVRGQPGHVPITQG